MYYNIPQNPAMIIYKAPNIGALIITSTILNFGGSLLYL